MSTATQHTGRALLYGILAIALLSFMDGAIKQLAFTNDVLVVTLGRYVFGAGFALAIWAQSGRPSITAEMWRAHAKRGVVIAISATLFFYSISVLPLAELIVITFIAPLIVPFVARAVLGERIRPRSFIAGLAGFAGVLVAASGGGDQALEDDRLYGVAAALASAVTYALSVTLLRARAGRDGAPVIGVLATIIPGAIVAGPAILTGEIPPASDIPVFLLLGALAAGGMYFFARAYANAEAQLLAPLEYTALIWAALIGYLFFNEMPRPQVYIGAVIIIAACLWGAREAKAAVMTPFEPATAPPAPLKEP